MRTIIFSKDRAAQLDLLLRSMPPQLFEDVHIIHLGSTPEFREGYQRCQDAHKGATFTREFQFSRLVLEHVKNADEYVMFLCDDDVFILPQRGPHPETILAWNPRVLTVSLRLGLNTTECYSLTMQQGLPTFSRQHRETKFWNWRGQKGDWGYPGSLDGNIWRRDDLLTLIAGGTWSNPNELEDTLNVACQKSLLPEVACYQQSCLVGNAVNMVNTTHQTNRFLDLESQSAEALNTAYLNGLLLNIPRLDQVKAAHIAQPLTWRESRDMSRVS